MKALIVAEKPSVAQDIAEALDALNQHADYFEGEQVCVTWCLGHLVRLAEPPEMETSWKEWSLASLPLIPAEWPLLPIAGADKRIDVIKKLCQRPDIGQLICATDAGREGELIFRWLYHHLNLSLEVRRLWLISLTRPAICQAFERLQPWSNYDSLFQAAQARAKADWLIGMNFSRLYGLMSNNRVSVGRVQTPTLGMVVDRDQAIDTFEPQSYGEVHGVFEAGDAIYAGTGPYDPQSVEKHHSCPLDAPFLPRLTRVRASEPLYGTITRLTREETAIAPPPPFSLTTLQQIANERLDLSAQETLVIAQRLYELHKLISYPRTDSQSLTPEIVNELGEIAETLRPGYGLASPEDTTPDPIRRYVQEVSSTDHHAIVPTGRPIGQLEEIEEKVFDLICLRFLAIWYPDAIEETTDIITKVELDQHTVLFRTSFQHQVVRGWRCLYPSQYPDEEAEVDLCPSTLQEGIQVLMTRCRLRERETLPPPHYTDSTLLTAMQQAGTAEDQSSIAQLGTAATRAGILENLISKKLLYREGRHLISTQKGKMLARLVDNEVRSPILTAQLEAALTAIEQRTKTADDYLSQVIDFVRQVTLRTQQHAPASAPKETEEQRVSPSAKPTPHSAKPFRDPLELAVHAFAQEPTSSQDQQRPKVDITYQPIQSQALEKEIDEKEENSHQVEDILKVEDGLLADNNHQISDLIPEDSKTLETRSADSIESPRPCLSYNDRDHDQKSLDQILLTVFGHKHFRPHQRAICESIYRGSDTLVVMPTGAGKSLCYQLPGLARGGTTLVISPLIALMEDQVAKLQAVNLRAEAIHSGRTREESKQVCRSYLLGELDFLFVAPERLGLPGFVPLLTRRRPTLIAVDEAHCISHWGHDFRPDYRCLRERLQPLRPAPIVALTATATKVVQQDMIHQLGLTNCQSFVHGFRRSNIAIEVTRTPQSERSAQVLKILQNPQRRPAIIYVATRKNCESLALTLKGHFSVEAYHAGLDPERRREIQEAFIAGRIEVITATVAFGMGVDKGNIRTVIHTALPGTVENYYQEIGRAGRDGKSSRAIMLYDFSDLKTHHFFLNRDYPDLPELRRIGKELRRTTGDIHLTAANLDLNESQVERALHVFKLFNNHPNPSAESWEQQYSEFKQHRHQQLKRMVHFAEGYGCRILNMLSYFGDWDDSRRKCDICDECAPTGAVLTRYHLATPKEQVTLELIFKTLQKMGPCSLARLWEAISKHLDISRNGFSRMVASLGGAGYVDLYWRQGFDDKRDLIYQEVTPRKSVEPDFKATPILTKPQDDLNLPQGSGAHVSSNEQMALFERISAWRKKEAEARGLPVYKVIGDRAMSELVRFQPKTIAGLEKIKGIGPAISGRYGRTLLQLMRERSPLEK